MVGSIVKTKAWSSVAVAGVCAMTTLIGPSVLQGQASAKKAPPARAAAAGAAAAGAAAKTAASAPVDSAAVVARLLATDERTALSRLTALRSLYLRKADWAELGDRCTPGALRVFPKDTTQAARDSVQAIAEAMEEIVVGRGAGSPLPAADARALLRVVVGWEAGIDRPNWDMAGTAKPRQAIATGLTGEVPDPAGPGCLPSPTATDTVTFVIPGFADMDFPRAPRPRVKAYFGPEGQLHARDEFFVDVGSKDPKAELRYILVAPMVIWKGYAMVGVRRPQELGGVQVDGSNRGGAAYLFRQVGKEWRLISVVRSWGG